MTHLYACTPHPCLSARSLVLGGLNAIFIPFAVPVLIARFPTHVVTYVIALVGLIFFASCVLIYRAARPSLGGGQQVAFCFEGVPLCSEPTEEEGSRTLAADMGERAV